VYAQASIEGYLSLGSADADLTKQEAHTKDAAEATTRLLCCSAFEAPEKYTGTQ